MNNIFNINDNEYLFINRCRDNRSGFVHETELVKNAWVIGTHKVQYYNRTWERYTYQTVMKCCVSNLMQSMKDKFISTWKTEHNIKRLTKAKREIMEKDFQDNMPKDYAELEELYKML